MDDVAAAPLTAGTQSERILLAGRVQGVGFRPFVYRLALEHGLAGQVRNRLGEVEIVAEGDARALALFRAELIERAPPLSEPRIVSAEAASPTGCSGFAVIDSEAGTAARVFVPPDYFMCDDCRRELADPSDRRYRYPFINCTQCGPRYTLIRALPYDRPNTSMTSFPLCPDCDAEYRDPADRRFHAEPVSCPACGPRITFERDGAAALEAESALEAAVEALGSGRIVAVKGIGGYHLMCDATDDDAVARLRWRKQRPAKPFAVMFPLAGDDGLAALRQDAAPGADEAALLASPARPIVLVAALPGTRIAAGVAPGLCDIGAFLPYSPLHQLLLDACDRPLVATSGNISGEPVLTDNDDARARLASVADAFVQHDRPIVRPADDPVWRRIAGRLRPLRMGRGSAPVELELPVPLSRPLLAVGGHMKGTVAIAWENRAVVSPHIGEMDSPRSLDVFEQVAADLQSLYGVSAERVVCDTHPGYTTTRWARRQALPVTMAWHHRAHASALAGEFPGEDDWLVFAWDGVGYGEDGTLWGGEALLGAPGRWRRAGSLRRFRLPGGERAGREPWRSAAALAWEAGYPWDGGPETAGLARAAWERGLNCPETSAAGRLFDAAAAFVTGITQASFEAQGPMELESLCAGGEGEALSLPIAADAGGVARIDWAPLLPMLTDTARPAAQRARDFHASLGLAITEQARWIRDAHGVGRVGLTGGVFQNRVLAGEACRRLRQAGFRVYLPGMLPCNDACLSYGQAVEFAALEARGHR